MFFKLNNNHKKSKTMDRNTVVKILKKESITLEELNAFIIDYVKHTLDKNISQIELSAITELVQSGIFSLSFAAEKVANVLGISITRIFNKNGDLLRTDII